MALQNKRKQIILSLFLLYFIVYAVSPLSHISPLTLADEHAYVEQEKPISFKSAGIFFLEILLSNFNDQKDADDSTRRLVLFKKIRAVVQSLSDPKYKFARISGNVENQLVLNIVPFTAREDQESSLKPYDNFLAVFSGLSPPST
jgi:ABC-type cobalamin transport system ATPase subunit